jgi:hypothetical protein
MFVGFFALTPVTNTSNSILTEENTGIISLYYFVFYLILFVSYYLYWRFFVKPYKLKKIDILSMRFFIVGLYLEEINYGLTLDNKLKKNLSFLEYELQHFKKKHIKQLDVYYVETIDKILNMIKKLNNYTSESVKDLLSNDRLSDRFFIISEILYHQRDYELIKKYLVELSNVLEGVPEGKHKLSYYLDKVTVLIIVSLAILISLAVLIPLYPPITSAFIVFLLTVLSFRLAGIRNP